MHSLARGIATAFNELDHSCGAQLFLIMWKRVDLDVGAPHTSLYGYCMWYLYVTVHMHSFTVLLVGFFFVQFIIMPLKCYIR